MTYWSIDDAIVTVDRGGDGTVKTIEDPDGIGIYMRLDGRNVCRFDYSDMQRLDAFHSWSVFSLSWHSVLVAALLGKE